MSLPTQSILSFYDYDEEKLQGAHTHTQVTQLHPNLSTSP